ncbi:MAG: response regulator [Candidatus Latescibacteria bacterium]|nr:response regulator [Candidatus Latescibacterota bacterium]
MIPKKRILVIDDEPHVVSVLQMNLEAEGYEVVTAYDGMEGLTTIRACQPDLVICDIVMPEMDGYQLCRLIREDTSMAALPFIFLTAMSETPNKVGGFSAGADDYMTKPFSMDEVLARVNALLARTARVREESQHAFQVTNQDLNRLSSLGVLAASIAHEVRNQLTMIVGSTEMLRYADEAKREVYMDAVAKQIERINRTILSMLNFARRQETVYTPQSLQSIVEEALELTRPRLLGHHVQIVIRLSDDVPLLSVDRQQVCQVLVNLLINASQAMNDGGRLEVWAGVVDHHVEIRVSDTGCGIPAEHLDHIFDPFMSTKDRSEGIGLGLYISKEIVEAHGGAITVESRVGVGTCFTISLPIDPAYLPSSPSATTVPANGVASVE